MEDLKDGEQLLGPDETKEQGGVIRMIGVALVLIGVVADTLFDFFPLLKRLWE